MEPRVKKGIFLYGTIALLVVLLALNIFLFFQLNTAGGSSWDFVELSDGRVFFGHVELLEGGYLQVSDLYTYQNTEHLQGTSSGSQFRIESLNPKTITLVKVEPFDEIKLGPNEIKQWGELSSDSLIAVNLERLEKARK